MSDGQLDVYDVLDLQAGRVPQVLGDASRRSPSSAAGRVCAWCAGPIPAGARRDAEVCGVVCRKRRWRFRKAVGEPSRRPGSSRDASRGDRAMRFAYADPPYPGKAGLYPEGQEVDHAELVRRLVAGYPDGWALSTSAAALRDVLAMCPASTRVCVWRRRTRPTTSRRALSAWEPLLVHRGRELATDRPQELVDVLDYRGRYDAFPDAMVGMKPPEFAVFMFAQLGARAGDELEDLFPGSGAIGRAWELYTSPGPTAATRDASQQAARDASRQDLADACRRAGDVERDACRPPAAEASRVARAKNAR